MRQFRNNVIRKRLSSDRAAAGLAQRRQATRILPVVTSGAAVAMWNGFRRVDQTGVS
jgi:hypothetical protein